MFTSDYYIKCLVMLDIEYEYALCKQNYIEIAVKNRVYNFTSWKNSVVLKILKTLFLVQSV